MRKRRRFIITLVQVLQILSIIMATLGGGWLGWQIQRAMDYGSYGFAIAGQPAADIVVPLLGGIIGFFLSAMGAALVFLLVEIAANTRATAFMLKRNGR
jgi:hypothetical protein